MLRSIIFLGLVQNIKGLLNDGRKTLHSLFRGEGCADWKTAGHVTRPRVRNISLLLLCQSNDTAVLQNGKTGDKNVWSCGVVVVTVHKCYHGVKKIWIEDQFVNWVRQVRGVWSEFCFIIWHGEGSPEIRLDTTRLDFSRILRWKVSGERPLDSSIFSFCPWEDTSLLIDLFGAYSLFLVISVDEQSS